MQIGSSPGFEDGEFDLAKLLRPAASIYDDNENCLYFVDAEVRSYCNNPFMATFYGVFEPFEMIFVIWCGMHYIFSPFDRTMQSEKLY